QGQAGGGDGLGRAHMLVGEAGGAAGEAHDVAAQHGREGPGREGRRRGRVVDLGAGRDARRQRRRSDVGRGGRTGRGEYVVTGIRARQGQAGGGDGLGRAHMLVGEAGGAAGEAHDVAAQHGRDGPGREGRCRGRVVDLGAGRDARRQRRRGDVGRGGRAGRGEYVVTGIR